MISILEEANALFYPVKAYIDKLGISRNKWDKVLTGYRLSGEEKVLRAKIIKKALKKLEQSNYVLNRADEEIK